MTTERDHAVLSASSAHRWLNCPPSAQIEEALPDTTSIYAEEGTLAHTIGELQLRLALKEITKRKYNSELKKLKEHEMFYEGMPEEVQEYTDFVIAAYETYKAADPEAEIYIEQRLDYSKYAPEGFGTGDAVILAFDTVHVIDLKFGKGVLVDVHENPQLKLYALGALEEFGFMHDIDTVRVSVAQVRLNSIPTFETDVLSLVKWGEEIVKPTAQIAFAGEGEFNSGDWCTFCKFRNKCKARASQMMEVYQAKKDRELSSEDIAELLPQLDELKKWATGIQEAALAEILEGGTIPGWKAVEGRSNRTISDEAGLAETLLKDYSEEEIYRPRSLQTITALEKLAGKKYFAEISGPFITKPQGKPTLAPESDRRPSITDITDELEFNK